MKTKTLVKIIKELHKLRHVLYKNSPYSFYSTDDQIWRNACEYTLIEVESILKRAG